jgi:hypothetical protein
LNAVTQLGLGACPVNLTASLVRTGSLTLDAAATVQLSAQLGLNKPLNPALFPREREEGKNMNTPSISVARLAAALKLPEASTEVEVCAALAALAAPAPATVKIKMGDKEETLDIAMVNNVDNTISGGNYAHPFTDKLDLQLMAKFPVGFAPNMVFMSRASRASLQQSRTVTLFGQSDTPTGANSGAASFVAPLPTATASGLPIVVTDSIQKGAYFETTAGD